MRSLLISARGDADIAADDSHHCFCINTRQADGYADEFSLDAAIPEMFLFYQKLAPAIQIWQAMTKASSSAGTMPALNNSKASRCTEMLSP
jgi:hypothetical protein